MIADTREQSQPPSSAQKRARSPSPMRQSSPAGPVPIARAAGSPPPSSAPPSSLPASSPPAGFSDFDDDGVEDGIPLDVTDGEEGDGEDLFGDEMGK